MSCLLRYSLIGLIGIAALAASSNHVNAYVTGFGQWPQSGGKNAPFTLTYSFQNMFDGVLKMPDGNSLPANIIRQSIEEALGVWASYIPVNYIEVPDDGLGYGQGSTNYGQIRFRHIYINGPDPPSGSPVAKAQAYFPESGDPYSGDVEFDHGDPWQVSGTLSKPDILGAAIHEIGHTLGLNHTDDSNANMYWVFHRFQGPGTGKLFPDDIAGIQSIYGTGVGSVTPLLSIPEPSTLATVLIFLGCIFFRRRRP